MKYWIHVNNPKHSEAVQDILFQKGYSWANGLGLTPEAHQFLYAKSIVAYSGQGALSYSDARYESMPRQGYVLVEIVHEVPDAKDSE